MGSRGFRDQISAANKRKLCKHVCDAMQCPTLIIFTKPIRASLTKPLKASRPARPVGQTVQFTLISISASEIPACGTKAHKFSCLDQKNLEIKKIPICL